MNNFVRNMGISLLLALAFALITPQHWFVYGETLVDYKPFIAAGIALVGTGLSVFLHKKEK